MSGDERVRFCGQCHHNVYNLSEMTAKEAEDLLSRHEGKLCVRFYRREDGTVMTSDCPVGLAKVRKALGRGIALAVGLILGSFGAGCRRKQTWPESGGIGPEEAPAGHKTTPLEEMGGKGAPVPPISQHVTIPRPITGLIAPNHRECSPLMGKPVSVPNGSNGVHS